MDLKVKHINLVGNIFQKIEKVCQEVDGIVGQDAVKYLESHVQNVGDSMKKFYSGVVHEILPLPTLVCSKYEAHSVALRNNIVKSVHDLLPRPTSIHSKHETQSVAPSNNIGSSVESVAGQKDSKEWDEENSMNNFIESLEDIANKPQAGAPINFNPADEVSDETGSDSLEVDDSQISQEEDGDSSETSGAKKENLNSSNEDIVVESVPELMSLIPVKEKDPLEFTIHSEFYSGSSDSGCGVLVGTIDNIDVNVEQNSCLVVEENAMNSSASQVLNSLSLDDNESIKVSVISESSDAGEDRILADVSSAVSCEPFCLKSSLSSDSLYSESLGGYSFEIEACKHHSCISDSSMVQTIESFPNEAVADEIMETHVGLVFYGHCPSVESSDELLVSSTEYSLEDIQLNDDPKLEESCVFVDDSELYAASSRAQKLRSYKKRIQDAFTSRKRLAKEYEQLAIWFGDADIEPSQSFSQTLLSLNSRTNLEPKNLQVQQSSEAEWELL